MPDANLATATELASTEDRLRQQIAATETRLLKWMVSVMLLHGGMVVSLIKLLP